MSPVDPPRSGPTLRLELAREVHSPPMPIHPTAVVDPTAVVHPSAEIGPNAFIGAGAEVGEGCWLASGVWLAPRTIVGARTRVHANACLGGDPQFIGFDTKTPSRVRVGTDCELRELCTVHRGLKPDSETTIGNGVMIMTAAHVGHDCAIGNNVVIASNSLVAGHVSVEERAFISGLVVIHQYCRIGRLAMLGGQAGIGQDVPPFCTVQGASGAGRLTGLNVVGMRRAGVSAEARKALRAAFIAIFKSGRTIKSGSEFVRGEWAGREMPAELEHFLAWIGEKSKRGYMGGFCARPEGGEEE